MSASTGSAGVRFRPGLSKLRSCTSPTHGWQGLWLRHRHRYTLVKTPLNTLADLVELFLQDFVRSTIGFGRNIASQFIEFVEGELKHRPLPWLLSHSEAVCQRFIGESWEMINRSAPTDAPPGLVPMLRVATSCWATQTRLELPCCDSERLDFAVLS